MKHIAVALIVASFGVMVMSDSAYLTKQVKDVETQLAAIHKLEQDYEHGVRTKSAAQEKTVLAELKKLQSSVKETRAAIEVHTEAEHAEVSFYERIILETLHIRTTLFEDTLKTIAQEILGAQNGISDYPVYVFSDKLESAKLLLSKRFTTILASTKTTDQIIVVAAGKNATLTAGEKTTINKNLDELVKSSTAVHDELAKDYFAELEKVHQEGKQLRLMQKLEVESLIDELNFVLHFLKSFHELFLRIDETEP